VHVPLSFHFDEADEILAKFSYFMMDNKSQIKSEYFQTFWNFIRENFSTSPNVRQLLPESVDDVQRALEQTSAIFNHPNFIRTPEWLEENGLCMDNIRAGKSNIPQAGRGAFATRPLAKGSVVAATPLFHECKRDNFLIHEGTSENGLENLNFDYSPYPVKGKQLMLNYCFGHSSSTMLLCPYGAKVGFINHSSDEPNVQIRWSTHSYHHRDWLDLTVDELCRIEHTGLMFDFVALRDILPGEEILLDYGKEWEDAWNEHVEEWVPPQNSENYVPAFTLNESELVVKTQDEEETNPYPSNIRTECYFSYSTNDPHEIIDGIPHRHYRGHSSSNHLLTCDIYKRESVDGVDMYTAGMLLRWDDEEDDFETIVSGIPREAIRFRDVKYTSDMHLKGAFRHEIMIPDEIFPNIWKNVNSKKEA